jgi:SPP1 gp7 family putative phage head morphogenesis protein
LPKPKDRVLRPVRPNAGIELAYRKKLVSLIDEMANSISYWLKAAYRQNEPVIAQDELPSDVLRNAIRKLARRWTDKFDEAAQELAKYFAQDVSSRSDATLRRILKDAGISVEWKMTRAMRDILHATVAENVSLIKSIPQRYLASVESIVMRGVQTGRDLEQIAKDLQEQHGVTKRRAALIARDQSNKATASLTRARQLEIGLTEAVWVHSKAGKTFRHSHVEMDGKRYDIRQGMWDEDEGEWVLPGQLIGCRCFARSVIPGFS